MAATLLRNNIIRAKEDVTLRLNNQQLCVVEEGQELTIGLIVATDGLFDNHGYPVPLIFSIKEFNNTLFPMCVLDFFEDAIDVSIDNWFNHKQEHVTNRIKRYGKI